MPLGAAHAQRILGVSWQLPSSESQAMTQLERFESLGFGVLSLKSVPSQRVWEEIDRLGFKVYGNLDIRFPTAATFAETDSVLRSRLRKKATSFLEQPVTAGLILFSFGAIEQSPFRQALNSLIKTFPQKDNIQYLYIGSRPALQSQLPFADLLYQLSVTPDNLSSVMPPMGENIGGYRLQLSDELSHLLTPLKRVMQATADAREKPLLLDGSWVLKQTSRHPGLTTILRSAAADEEPLFPVPEETLPEPTPSPLPALVLLIVWGVLGYHYNMSPLYRKSLFRYFTAHRFFLDAIYHRQIRSPLPSLIIMGQNALLMGAAVFIVASNLWTPLGLQSLAAHYPALFFLSSSAYDLFILTVAIVLAYSLISLIWLYVFHKQLKSITQIMILFAWPLQINIVLGTLIIALHVSGVHSSIITTAAGCMMLVSAGSFIITATDATRFLAGKRARYLLLTTGVFLLLLIAAGIGLLVFNDRFWEVLNLSLQLI